MKPSTILTTALCVVSMSSYVPPVFAQSSTVTSSATCFPTFSWMLNSFQETPCLTAAYLSAPCHGGQWDVASLGGSLGPYEPLSGNGISPCRCNTVVYNLLSACSACQNGRVGKWSDYKRSCPTSAINVDQYPYIVPDGTAIPRWAFQDPTKSDMFDVVLAKSQGDIPEQEPGSSPTTIALPTKKISHRGAIIGGVVGGVVFLITIGILAYVCVWKWQPKRPEDIGDKEPGPSEAFKMNRTSTVVKPSEADQAQYPVMQPDVTSSVWRPPEPQVGSDRTAVSYTSTTPFLWD